jgi:hypothetical protein
VPTATLLSPFGGSTVNVRTLIARPYIDVVFSPAGPGKVVGVNGNELLISGPGAENLATDPANPGFRVTTVTEIAPNTYRYFLSPKATATASTLWLNGQVTIDFIATLPNTTTPTWCVRTDNGTDCSGTDSVQRNPGSNSSTFTVDSTTVNSAAASTATTIGPLTLDGFTIGLAGTAFVGGKLVLTIGVEANAATLAFGGTAAASGQTSSGITANLTGILGTFDVAVDIAKAAGAISNPAQLLDAFSVTGKWGLSIATLLVDVPNVVRVTGEALKVTFDPNYGPRHQGPAAAADAVERADRVPEVRDHGPDRADHDRPRRPTRRRSRA